MNKPLISVVTVCYNASLILEETVKSVLTQKYENLQYLIIDGNSKDSTLDIINKYKTYISYFISEPDNGIYDAMNKAIDKATGEWIIFMNAGDLFIEGALNKIFSTTIDTSVDVIYGDTIIKYPFGNKYINAGFFKDNDIALPFCHQSTFVRTKCAKSFHFDLSYKIAADYNFFYTLYQNKSVFLYIPIPISQYNAIGFSTNRVLETFKEVCAINGHNHGFKYKLKLLYFAIRNYLIQKIPNFIIVLYRKWKYSRNYFF